MGVQFTEHARSAMALAEEASRAYRHDFVGTEHLLLGLLQESSGVTASTLKIFGIDPVHVRAEIEKLITPGANITTNKLPLTPRAKRTIEFAGEEANILLQNRVGPEHLLLGLLREPDGVAGRALLNLGLNLSAVMKEALKVRLTQFKIVERAVRPVRAVRGRKRKMREELLAHLTAIYEQELARLSDPAAAMNEAARRFGDPAELTRALEGALPISERWEYQLERLVGWRPPESAAKYMLRAALQMLALIGITGGLMIAAAIAQFGWNSTALIAIRPAAALMICPADMFLLGLLYFKMRDASFGVFGAQKSRSRVLLLATALAVVVFISGLGFIALLDNPARAIQLIDACAAAAVAAAIGYALWARIEGPAEIRDVAWACLEIAE